MDESAAASTVTILIAAYNAAPFLHRAVASALRQGPSVAEVLIVDDCSTDDTVAVAEGFAAADARVRVLKLDRNGGPAVARNAALDAGRGEWVAILDADDAFVPGRIAQLLDAAHALQADVVVDNFAWYQLATGTVGQPAIAASSRCELAPLHRFVAKAMPYTGEADWGLLKPMFRRAFLDSHGLRYPTHSRHGEDYLLMMRVLLAGARYVLTPTLSYLYTDRSSGLSRTRVDYGQMVADSRALLDDPRIANDPRLARLMARRVAALRRLAVDHAIRLDAAAGRLASLGPRALREPRVAIGLARYGWQRAHAWARATARSWLRR